MRRCRCHQALACSASYKELTISSTATAGSDSEPPIPAKNTSDKRRIFCMRMKSMRVREELVSRFFRYAAIE
ncbi:hypothetical protein GHK01_31360, partial [Sinorhizobium meliloti]|nr:hypothetical protein [Sinorhizobium meliloti]